MPANAPHKLPYWRSESQNLRDAIQAYFDIKAGVQNAVAPTAEQLTLIKDYITKWANYQHWKVKQDDEPILQLLRDNASTINSSDGISAWLVQSLPIGIDPF